MIQARGDYRTPSQTRVLIGIDANKECDHVSRPSSPAWLHAVADYAVGGLLIIVALVAGGTAGATATGIVVGAVVLLVSMLTKYPLGVVKVLPFTVHSAGDYLAALLLVAAPFVLNFSSSDTGLSAFYVVAGVAVLAVSLITNYQYSPKREWSGAQAATA